MNRLLQLVGMMVGCVIFTSAYAQSYFTGFGSVGDQGTSLCYTGNLIPSASCNVSTTSAGGYSLQGITKGGGDTSGLTAYAYLKTGPSAYGQYANAAAAAALFDFLHFSSTGQVYADITVTTYGTSWGSWSPPGGSYQAATELRAGSVTSDDCVFYDANSCKVHVLVDLALGLALHAYVNDHVLVYSAGASAGTEAQADFTTYISALSFTDLAGNPLSPPYTSDLGITYPMTAAKSPVGYAFTTVDVPGSTYTTLWGINNNGQAAGDAIVDGNYSGFVYDHGTWTPLPPPPAGLTVGGIGINDALVVVGGASPPDGSFEQGFILDMPTATYKSFFSHPGSGFSEARAIGNSGLITGYSATSCSSGIGWIYDPGTNAFTDIDAGGIATLAQGINKPGQVVGSYFTGYDPVTCGWFGGHSFLRQPDGTINLFDIAGYHTHARGIDDHGLIAGFVVTPPHNQAFIGNSSGFQLLSVPGSVETIGEGLNNAGQVSGGYTDATGNGHGFIATPAYLPSGTTASGAYIFNVDVVPNVEIFIDPKVAVGYDYAIGDGNPMFAAVRLPIGIGDNLYTLIVRGRSFGIAGGEFFDFRTHGFSKGVAQFRVADIEASAGLNPADATAFVTGVSFMATGSFTGTMTPLCQAAPLPQQAKVPPGRALSPCGQ